MSLKPFKNRYPGIVRRLGQTRLKNRVSHSWVFTGDNAADLNQFVYSWLKTCICEQPTDEGDACDNCHHCQQLEKRNYPHLFEIKPTSKSRQILVDEIRDLEHFLCLRTAREKKLGLILDADCMGIQAQNAFLKTLEEPVSDSILVLATQNAERLLPTIRSRCQTIALFSNQFQYNFKGSDQLFTILSTMRKGTGAMVAVSASDQINGILTKLRKKAESLSKKEKESDSSETRELKKKKDSLIQAQEASYYLSFRSQVVSAIHAWYGQEFLRSNGIPIESVPHPEFYEAIPEDVKQKIPKPNDALASLQVADSLMARLTLNVSETLAFQEFCYRVCAKGDIT